jgi:hypothetical protein
MRLVRLATGVVLVPALVALNACDGGAGDDDDDQVSSGQPDAAPPLDPPFDGEVGTWMWLDVPGAECMDGSRTGVGLNVGPRFDKLMIFFEGGGACFNGYTCAGVANQDGYDSRDLATWIGTFGSRGIFDRNDADNPLKDWTFVFVPYCTGDIFAGTNPEGFGGRKQVGYTNVGHLLDLLVPEVPATEVLVTGASAGGFGAAYNFVRIQEAFGPDVRATLLDDSGPPLADDFMTPCLQQQIRQVWGLDASLPADCADCTGADGGGLVNVIPYAAARYPDRKLGIVSSTRDGVIRLFYGQGWPNCQSPQSPMPEQKYAEGIADLRDRVLAPLDNVSMFTIESGLHVWLLESPVGTTTVDGTKLTDWIRALMTPGDDVPDVVP